MLSADAYLQRRCYVLTRPYASTKMARHIATPTIRLMTMGFSPGREVMPMPIT